MAKKKGKNVLEDIYSIYEEHQEVEEVVYEEEEGLSAEEEHERQPAPTSVHQIASKLERLTLQRTTAPKPKEVLQTQPEVARANTSTDYRSPICCILGHADTGKTKILDRIRETDVQLSEAGGITQQIGATYIPTQELEKRYQITSEHLPGLLVIDTPGHAAFSNLRTRGSSMCNMVVLVIDIMHGLELQTKESIEILRARKTPFIIALNKIDRIAGWVSVEGPFSIKAQKKAAQLEFRDRYEKIVLDLATEGLNSAIFSKNPDPKRYISIVPTSAITGEGLGQLLSLLITLVETRMLKKVRFEEQVECMVLESRSEEGKAPGVDVILSNGTLTEGDRIVLCTQTGAIETVIRKLLTPRPMKDTRTKTKYVENKQVRAAIGVRIEAPKLEGALAGSKVYVVTEDTAEASKQEVEHQIRTTVKGLITGATTESGNIFDTVGEDGVHVQASTLGSLEALITILKAANVPIRTVGVGSIGKKDLVKASTIGERHPEYSLMLCFDIKPSSEMEALAKELGVKIIRAEIVYHLTERYHQHMEEFWEKAAEALKDKVVFPCILTIVPRCIFTTRSPLVLGVKVEEGILRLNTPLVVMRDGVATPIGKVTSILEDKKQNPKNDKLKAGSKASIKVEVGPTAAPIIIGRKLFETDELISRLTRDSIDLLKESFKDALTKNDWMTVIKIKKILGIF
ncbi:translation initiation factor 5B [Nematocida displodere]|uniref:Eukaryotic translation initiation factor 5B n=1 Tax=Nematocida displodere TaxID=1805483 RepID=A0A177EAY9_9MICR|nr:translation initiation factor 5B [Nematocida displodere]